jgi:hypothetical protein
MRFISKTITGTKSTHRFNQIHPYGLGGSGGFQWSIMGKDGYTIAIIDTQFKKIMPIQGYCLPNPKGKRLQAICEKLGGWSFDNY